ncbi:MAG: DoxX family protein [Gammaproteobacteria bacterium]|nr:DoxX family protein [Gammaproteobacteria bacterium]
MTPAIDTAQRVWTAQRWRQHPLRMTGIVLHLVLRTLFGLFWIAAGVNKLQKDWLTTDILRQIFADRLTELHPDSLQVMFLQDFAIPFYKLVAVFVTVSELYVGVALLLGLTTRWAAGIALVNLLGFSAGGYYDASLIPFFALGIMMMSWPSGRWLGLDGPMSRRYPGSRWF